MKDIRKKIEEISGIENSFFDVDEEAKITYISLLFDSPAAIFDNNYQSKMPILSDDFMDWLRSAFVLVSPKYKIDLDVKFADMQGYSEEQMQEIFIKNMELEFKSKYSDLHQKNVTAYALILAGLIFFVLMVLISHLWKNDSIWKDIFVYISDIATTVTFWEAMSILVVQQPQRTAYLKNLNNRFSAIHFSKEN